jgi:16S rRNA (guanine527-N7)-methyltransferase
VENTRIAELLRPFLDGVEPDSQLLGQLQRYLDLLVRWNARINLTAIRDPEQMVTRHFGESLFAARVLAQRKPQGSQAGSDSVAASPPLSTAELEHPTMADVGSGAGFPGIPIKLALPQIQLTLIESQGKKATFLREALRTLQLDGVQVFSGRAEAWGNTADIVTLRAVEQFERTLSMAAKLVAPGGRLCLLIGRGRVETARALAGGEWTWAEPEAVPKSAERVVLLGSLRRD